MKFLINFILIIISFLDYLKFNKKNQKIVKTFNVENIEIETDTGFKSLSHIHLLQVFLVY